MSGGRILVFRLFTQKENDEKTLLDVSSFVVPPTRQGRVTVLSYSSSTYGVVEVGSSKKCTSLVRIWWEMTIKDIFRPSDQLWEDMSHVT